MIKRLKNAGLLLFAVNMALCFSLSTSIPVFAQNNTEQVENSQQETQEAPEDEAAPADEENPEADGEQQEEEQVVNSVSHQNGLYSLTLLANARLRSEPTVESATKVTIPFGISVTSDSRVVNSSGETWYHASYANASGYVRDDMVSVVDLTASQQSDEQDAEAQAEDGENADAEIVETGNAEAENTDEGQEASETSDSSTTAIATAASSYKDVSPGQFVSDGFSSDTTYVDSSGAVTTTKHRTLDYVFYLFMLGAGVLLAVAAFIYGRMRMRYRKLKKHAINKLNRS